MSFHDFKEKIDRSQVALYNILHAYLSGITDLTWTDATNLGDVAGHLVVCTMQVFAVAYLPQSPCVGRRSRRSYVLRKETIARGPGIPKFCVHAASGPIYTAFTLRLQSRDRWDLIIHVICSTRRAVITSCTWTPSTLKLLG